MKVYVLESIINNNLRKEKYFKTRKAADKYLAKLLDENRLSVEDVIYRDNNHSQEFVCDYYNRFIVSREIISL